MNKNEVAEQSYLHQKFVKCVFYVVISLIYLINLTWYQASKISINNEHLFVHNRWEDFGVSCAVVEEVNTYIKFFYMYISVRHCSYVKVFQNQKCCL